MIGYKVDYWVVIGKDQRPISEEQEKGKANEPCNRSSRQFQAVRIAYLKNTQYFIEHFGDDDVSVKTKK